MLTLPKGWGRTQAPHRDQLVSFDLCSFLQLYSPASCFPSPLQLYVEVRAQKDPARGVSFETKNSLSWFYYFFFFFGQHVAILNLSLNWHTGSLSNRQLEGTGQNEFTGHSRKASGWKYHFQLLFDEVTSRSRAAAHTTRATAKWFAGPVNATLRKGETFAKSVKNELDVF